MTPSDAYIEYSSGDILTDFYNPNEVCEGMWQGAVMRGPGAGRWRVYLYLVRNDAIAKFVIDAGPASLFSHVPQLFIPGDGETTVSEFVYESERHRSDTRWANEHIARLKAESTLWKDIQDNYEKRNAIINNRTVIGPYYQYQRNGYSRTETWREYFAKRRARSGKIISTRGLTT